MGLVGWDVCVCVCVCVCWVAETFFPSLKNFSIKSISVLR